MKLLDRRAQALIQLFTTALPPDLKLSQCEPEGRDLLLYVEDQDENEPPVVVQVTWEAMDDYLFANGAAELTQDGRQAIRRFCHEGLQGKFGTMITLDYQRVSSLSSH